MPNENEAVNEDIRLSREDIEALADAARAAGEDVWQHSIDELNVNMGDLTEEQKQAVMDLLSNFHAVMIGEVFAGLYVLQQHMKQLGVGNDEQVQCFLRAAGPTTGLGISALAEMFPIKPGRAGEDRLRRWNEAFRRR